MTPARDPILLEVAAALGAGRISLRVMRCKAGQVHGYTHDDGRVFVNMAPSTVDTVIHELIHRLRPKWSERAVKAKTTRLMRQMSDNEIETLFVMFLTTAKLRKTVEVK